MSVMHTLRLTRNVVMFYVELVRGSIDFASMECERDEARAEAQLNPTVAEFLQLRSERDAARRFAEQRDRS